MLNATRRHDVNKILYAVQRASLIIRNREIAINSISDYMEALFAANRTHGHKPCTCSKFSGVIYIPHIFTFEIACLQSG